MHGKYIKISLVIFLLLIGIRSVVPMFEHSDIDEQQEYLNRIENIREENDKYTKVDVNSSEVDAILSNLTEVMREEVDENQYTKAPKAETVDESTFSSCYAYSVLPDNMKLLYNEVYTMVINHTKSAIVSSVEPDEIADVFIAIDADHPELFWFEGYSYVYYTLDDEITDIELQPTYTIDESQCDAITELIEKNVDLFLQHANDNMSYYDRAKYVYEMLITNVDYESGCDYNQNIISVFLNRKTVCKGYASAAQYLLREMGIQSIVVRGEANNEAHAWNMINIDGRWYHYDVTWGNSQYLDGESKAKRIRYDYLNITDDELSKTHIIDMPFELPVCNSTEDNYFVKENRYVYDYDEELIGHMFEYVYYAGQPTCEIKFANYDIYQQAVSTFIDNSYIGKYCKGLHSYQYLPDDDRCVLTVYF